MERNPHLAFIIGEICLSLSRFRLPMSRSEIGTQRKPSISELSKHRYSISSTQWFIAGYPVPPAFYLINRAFLPRVGILPAHHELWWYRNTCASIRQLGYIDDLFSAPYFAYCYTRTDCTAVWRFYANDSNPRLRPSCEVVVCTLELLSSIITRSGAPIDSP